MQVVYALSEKESDPLVDAKKCLEIGLVGKGQTPFPTSLGSHKFQS